MEKTLVTKEHLEELGFEPYGRFWILESKDLEGSITYNEEIMNMERYYCVRLLNRNNQEVRFFTEELYVEDIISVLNILKTT